VKVVDVSALASGTISETRAASDAVAVRDMQGAKTHVNQAISQVSQIAETSGAPNLIPLSVQVATTSTYRPVKHGKDEELTAKRLKKDSNVRDSTAEITRSSLNVAMAQEQLTAARAALNRDDFAAARAALAGAQNAVVQQSVKEDVPLLRAQQNLELARARVMEGRYKEAEAPLRSAAQALQDYCSITPGPHCVTVSRIAEDMNEYSDHVDKDHALERIEIWLDPVAKWYQESLR
jgi:hypothetical protein